jgi:hypothetical protein
LGLHQTEISIGLRNPITGPEETPELVHLNFQKPQKYPSKPKEYQSPQISKTQKYPSKPKEYRLNPSPFYAAALSLVCDAKRAKN